MGRKTEFGNIMLSYIRIAPEINLLHLWKNFKKCLLYLERPFEDNEGYIRMTIKAKNYLEGVMMDLRSIIRLREKEYPDIESFYKCLGFFNQFFDASEKEMIERSSITISLAHKDKDIGSAKYVIKKLREDIIKVIDNFVLASLKNAIEKYIFYITNLNNDEKKYEIRDFIFDEMIDRIKVLGTEHRFELPKLKPIISTQRFQGFDTRGIVYNNPYNNSESDVESMFNNKSQGEMGTEEGVEIGEYDITNI